MQMTIEAVPKEENNPFNKYSPRFVNVDLALKPHFMSKEFELPQAGEGGDVFKCCR